MKIKNFISLFLAITVICLFAACKKASKTTDSNNSTETTTNGTMHCIPEERLTITGKDTAMTGKAETAQTVSDTGLVIVNGKAAVADDTGFSIIDEKTGTEKQVDNKPASSVVFDGRTAYYVRTGIEDKSVRIWFDDDAIVENKENETWLRGEVYIYSSEKGSAKKLFSTNHESTKMIYFDSENLYYTDYADKNVGYYIGSSQYIAPTLYKYNLSSGKKTAVSEFASKAEAYGSYIFINACDSLSTHHPDFINPGPIHIYDTKTGADIKADEYGELLFKDGEYFYYLHVDQDDGNVTGGKVMYCKADGSDLHKSTEISGDIESRYGHYITVYYNDDNKVTVYNTKTKKESVCERYNLLYSGGELLSVRSDEADNSKIYRVTDTGKEEIYAQINGETNFIRKTSAGIYSEEYKNDKINIEFIKSGN